MMARTTLTLDDLVVQLRQVHGAALECVVLYGSAAVDEQIAGRSDLNVLVIVRTLSLDALRTLGQTVRAWNEAGNPPPLTLTRAEWDRSADIFPMEYADILERHRVLFGTAPFDGSRVTLEHLRLELEFEAMGKMLRLRQGVMAAGTDPARQADLLRASFGTLLVLFRSLLRLHGERPPRDQVAIVRAAAARAGFDPAAFERVAALVRGTPIPAGETPAVLASYLSAMDHVVQHLDRYTPPAASGGPPSTDSPST